MLRALPVLFFAWFVAAAPCRARQTSGSSLLVRAPSLVRIAVHEPAGPDPGSSIPLVIGMHGGGSSDSSFADIWRDVSGAEFLYVPLRAPYRIENAPGRMYEWALWPSADTTVIRTAGEALPEYVRAVIGAVRDRYPVGSVYLAGFSQGAIYAYLVGMSLVGEVNGIVAFSGPGLRSPLGVPFIEGSVLPTWIGAGRIEGATSLRVFIVHGTADRAAPIALAEESRRVLADHGYDVTLRSFDGGHRLPPPELMHEVAQWILLDPSN